MKNGDKIMYMFVKMLDIWCGEEFDSYIKMVHEIEPHVSNGNIVIVGDDIEIFADKIGIGVGDIVMI